MDTNVTLVGVIILLVIILPVLYMIFVSSGSEKKAKKTIMQLSQAKGANPQKMEVIGNTIIGLDDVSKKLVYSLKENPEKNFHIFDLAELKDCHARTQKLNDTTLSWVGLELVTTSGKHEISFYEDDSEDGHSRDPQVCLLDARRWADTIRPLLNK